MVRTEGITSLYKGLLPAIVSMGPAGAVFYGVYDILKSNYLKSPESQREAKARSEREKKKVVKGGQDAVATLEIGPVRTLLFGAIAGACAETVTYPFEVVRRQMQMQEAATKLSIVGTIGAIVQKGGVGALYAGVLPSTIQVLFIASTVLQAQYSTFFLDLTGAAAFRLLTGFWGGYVLCRCFRPLL